LSNRFGGRAAEHSFGGRVPRGDDAVESLADDGVVRRIDDRAKSEDIPSNQPSTPNLDPAKHYVTPLLSARINRESPSAMVDR
jgi:hypothetical protein